MNEEIAVAAAYPPARAPAGRFDRVSIALHWLTVILVAGQLTTAWLMTRGGEGAAALLTLHRSMGMATWIVSALRLAWRSGPAHLPPFPAGMPKLQQWAAKLNEYGLYALLLAQPVTGMAATLLRGRPFELFAWRVPPLLAANKAASHLLFGAHEAGAWALLALIGLHAVAALFHEFVLRDSILRRMLPWTAP